jgi:MFS family permease
MDYLHERNVRGYITFNTLVFRDKLSEAAAQLEAIAAAGADAIIVQDLGLVRLAQHLVLMATGTLADRFGRKLVFCIAIMLFGITSLLCGLNRRVWVIVRQRNKSGQRPDKLRVNPKERPGNG